MKRKTKTIVRTFKPDHAIEHLLARQLKASRTTLTLLIENAIAATYGKGQNILIGTRWEKFAEL